MHGYSLNPVRSQSCVHTERALKKPGQRWPGFFMGRFLAQAFAVVASGLAACPRDLVLFLNVVAFCALVVVVIDGSAGFLRVEWIYFHIKLLLG